MAPSATDASTALGSSLEKTAGAEEKRDEKTPIEAICHGDVLPGIPTFPTFAAARRHTLIHMAAVFRLFARRGFDEGMSGHISVRDPEFPNCMWMNPLGVHFGLLQAADMLLLELDTGRIVAGRHRVVHGGRGVRTANAAGFFIHRAVHRARPHNVHAVAHAHTVAGRAWTAFGRPLDMLTQDVCNFYGAHAVYEQYGGIVFADEEGERIAAALGPANKAVLLLNHGLLTVGETVDEAGYLLDLLDRSCAIQLQVEAAAAGSCSALQKRIISDEEAAYNFRMASDPHALYNDAQPGIERELAAAGNAEALAKGLDQLVVKL